MSPEPYIPRNEIDPLREQYLKGRFSEMNSSSIADYYRTHSEDPDLHEYMTRYATPDFNARVLKLLSWNSGRPEKISHKRKLRRA